MRSLSCNVGLSIFVVLTPILSSATPWGRIFTTLLPKTLSKTSPPILKRPKRSSSAVAPSVAFWLQYSLSELRICWLLYSSTVILYGSFTGIFPIIRNITILPVAGSYSVLYSILSGSGNIKGSDLSEGRPET